MVLLHVIEGGLKVNLLEKKMKIDALLKQLSVSALVVGFVVSCGGEPVKDEEAPVAEETTQADPAQASAKQAIADAYAALDEAKAVGAEWRDTGKYLKKAQKAYDAGDYAKAEKIANAMKLQSENAVSQQQAEAAKFEPATSFDEEQTSATVTTDESNNSDSINGITSYSVVKGDIFEDGKIYENWIRGQKQTLKDHAILDIRGKYDFKINDKSYKANIKGSLEKPSGSVMSIHEVTDSLTSETKMDTLKSKMEIKFEGKQVSFLFKVKDNTNDGIIQLNGSYYPKLNLFEGNALLPNGNWVKWNGIQTKAFESKKVEKTFEIDTTAIGNTHFPNMAYGFDSLPQTKTYFIKNATLWTNEEEGVIKNANLLIVDGKIKSVNKKTTRIPNGAIVIDAEGKHVTTGIIDEHSHIAISKGVNESGQSVSAEVSIADVVKSNDINIYRQLAGGVTCSQLLHGSANPIGGQSALVKLKWGYAPEQMLVPNADGFIKFALGENVKQSNWGDYNRVRFPQTRMGVEQVFYDAFTRAKLYKEEWNNYNNLSDKQKIGVNPPRKDLEMETILEILESKRFVTCHSYIQSEINMLMHVADSMGFRMNTFTHILEGYKVADKMKAHGVGASTFSDWWAYKFEVNEAIPYNAAILNKMGIVTALNSDDAEMGRRLNQEAAKIVKYGGVSEQDAWKMVTLNPAKLLHIDDRMGSIKEGKDADIVIWSNNPLSIKAKVEKTFIDGILFYDKERNDAMHKRDQIERKRLIKLMIEAKNGGAKTQKPIIKKQRHYHCDTVGE